MKKRIFSMMLCFFLLVSAMFGLVSCGPTGSEETGVSSDNAFVCKKEDWTSIKDSVCSGRKSGKMINTKALSKATDSLIVGKSYYFVTAVYFEMEPLSLNGNNSSVWSSAEFELYNSQGTDYMWVSQGDCEYEFEDTLGDISGKEEGRFLEFTPYGSTVYGYVATEFTPLEPGTLHCSSYTSQMLAENEGAIGELAVSVFANEEALEGASTVSVSNLIYEFSEDAEKEYITITCDMNVETLSGEDDSVICGIHMENGVWDWGPWDSLTVESANTGKTWDIEVERGRMMAFSYNVNSKGARQIEITLGFKHGSTAVDEIDIFISLFSETAILRGQLQENYYALAQTK